MQNIFDQPFVPDDTVRYLIYQVPPETPGAHTTPQGPSSTNPAQALLGAVTEYLAPLISGYIWQREAFRLEVAAANLFNPLTPVLQGVTQFADCLDDEWFIVYLLRKLTDRFSDLAARVTDSDGEFLLIEAADVIPSWLTPENSENRVFIYRGHLHIITDQTTHNTAHLSDGLSSLSVQQALTALRDHPQASVGNTSAQAKVFERIAQGPAVIHTANCHRTRCCVPRAVAHLLFHQPQLIAPAVEAFYLREPVGLAATRAMQQFPPGDSVLTTVRWTRTMYAQVRSQTFVAPHVFETAFASCPQYMAREKELGMKLACGFEMLCQGVDICDPELPSRLYQQEQVQKSRTEWEAYLAKLTSVGYFEGERAGSQRYRELEASARAKFDKRPAESADFSSTDDAPKLGYRATQLLAIHKALQLPQVTQQELHAHLIDHDDSDAWMYIKPEHLDDMLGKYQKDLDNLKNDVEFQHVANSESRQYALPTTDEKEEAAYIGDMIDKFQTFIHDEAGFEGIGADSESDTDSDISEDDVQESQATDGPQSKAGAQRGIGLVSFNPEAFFQTLEATLGKFPEPSVPASMRGPQSRQVRFATDHSSTCSEDELGPIMDAMDAQLQSTHIGDSFRPLSSNAPTPLNHRHSSSVGKVKVAQTSAEPGTAETTISGGSNIANNSDNLSTHPLDPVDVDINLVQNILESFKSQQGLPGPAGNLLATFNIHLPPGRDEADSEHESTPGQSP
ncbi:hypothetical protein H4R34_002412 [Dimargaris verticillata]|uniref:SGT1 protein-domain-containing protein n=1 Tax=Dimargaris verticillata TaxID=2761393 RepID=A0A9W8B8U9_9FUNG|nr:hypothetical protein H4R34_002412 [Dimargaris verticillata]